MLNHKNVTATIRYGAARSDLTVEATLPDGTREVHIFPLSSPEPGPWNRNARRDDDRFKTQLARNLCGLLGIKDREPAHA